MAQQFVAASSQALMMDPPPILNGPGSVSFWLKANSFSANACPLSFSSATDEGWYILMQNVGGWNPLLVTSGGGYTHRVLVSMSTGVWYHVCIRVNADGTGNVYVDGSKSLTAGGTAAAVANFTRGAIGAYRQAGSSVQLPFDGLISHVAFFDYALADTTIGLLANKCPPRLCTPYTVAEYLPLAGGVLKGIRGNTLTDFNTSTSVSDAPGVLR
jgi:hypothetical protein